MNHFVSRPIRPTDNIAMGMIIRGVMTEFGASGDGFSIHDKEVDQMFESYSRPRSAYFVVCTSENPNLIFGGAGIAPLEGGSPDTCELKKMYFLQELRGIGFGQTILNLCLKAAKSFDFKVCYLETLKSMTQANLLYKKNGFHPLQNAWGKTGHFACDAWFAKELE